MKIQKIGIITSGGDCGGLNAVVKGTSQMATQKKIQTYAIPNGYAGLYNLLDTESCLLYTSPSPRDLSTSRMPSSA